MQLAPRVRRQLHRPWMVPRSALRRSRAPGDLETVRQVERRDRAERGGVAVPALVRARAGRADQAADRDQRVGADRVRARPGDVVLRAEADDRTRRATQAVAERDAGAAGLLRRALE